VGRGVAVGFVVVGDVTGVDWVGMVVDGRWFFCIVDFVISM